MNAIKKISLCGLIFASISQAYRMEVINTTDGIVSVSIRTTAGPTYTGQVDPNGGVWRDNTIGWCPESITVTGVTGSTASLSNTLPKIRGNRCKDRTIHIVPIMPLRVDPTTALTQYSGLDIRTSN